MKKQANCPCLFTAEVISRDAKDTSLLWSWFHYQFNWHFYMTIKLYCVLDGLGNGQTFCERRDMSGLFLKLLLIWGICWKTISWNSESLTVFRNMSVIWWVSKPAKTREIAVRGNRRVNSTETSNNWYPRETGFGMKELKRRLLQQLASFCFEKQWFVTVSLNIEGRGESHIGGLW